MVSARNWTHIVSEDEPGIRNTGGQLTLRRVLARQLIDRASYKTDNRRKQTDEKHENRRVLLDRILNGEIEASFGICVQAPRNLADDPSGDQLDALLCAIQAAWTWTMRGHGYGARFDADSLEGWIADPSLR
jgi:hypothetical protein